MVRGGKEEEARGGGERRKGREGEGLQEVQKEATSLTDPGGRREEVVQSQVLQPGVEDDQWAEDKRWTGGERMARG
eukprot:110137-Hanusia_phi.AAC.1